MVMDILDIQVHVRNAQEYIQDSLARLAMNQEPQELTPTTVGALLRYRRFLASESIAMKEAERATQAALAREIQYIDEVAGDALVEWVEKRADALGRRAIPTEVGEVKIRTLPDALEVVHEEALVRWVAHNLPEALTIEISAKIPYTLSHDKKQAIIDAFMDAGIHISERNKVSKKTILSRVQTDGEVPDGASLRCGARRLYIGEMTINECPGKEEVGGDRQALQAEGSPDTSAGDRTAVPGAKRAPETSRTLGDETLSALSGDPVQPEGGGQ
jgi:hypothetical protein